MRLREEFGRDPRVRVAPEHSALDEFPASAFHVTLPAAVAAKDLVHRLHRKLGDAVTAGSILPDGSTVTITRAWALHRARRTGKDAAVFGEARTIPAVALKLAAAGPAVDEDRAGGSAAGSWCAEWERLLERMKEVGGFADAWSLLKQLAGSIRRRALRRRQ